MDRIRAAVSVGAAIALEGYDAYGIAFPIRAGVDVPILRASVTEHRLVLGAQYARFSRAFLRDPDAIEGVTLDTGAVHVGWRVVLLPAQGLHADLGTGLLVGHDQIQLRLPARDVSSSETRIGIPIEVGGGWTIRTHFDIGLHYTLVVFPSGAPAELGYPSLTMGVRI